MPILAIAEAGVLSVPVKLALGFNHVLLFHIIKLKIFKIKALNNMRGTI
jgi:hypothetical protein